MKRSAAIGVFDSGLGGLTVLRAIAERLPSENLLYLGDTARVPYGTRSAKTVLRYARNCAAHLQQHGIKAMVVACNTVSAVAIDMLRVETDLPVLGVIRPGAQAAVEASQSGRIGVVATAGTVASGAYGRAVAGLCSRAELTMQAAPLWVPLVEEGWLQGQVPSLVVQKYLQPFQSANIDVLVLGCTHYPMLTPIIESELATLGMATTKVINSAEATAQALQALLSQHALLNSSIQPGDLRIRVTDLPESLNEKAQRFLGALSEHAEIQAVDL